MNKSIYKSIIIASLICCIGFTFLAFYSTGVIDRANTRELLGERINQVSEKLDDNIYETRKISEEIYNNYKSKSRILAMMLSRNKSIMTDESSFEELRMAIGADVISVTDGNGIIQYSTNLSSEQKKAYDDFFPAIDNKVFSEAILNTNNGRTVVMTGCSRLDLPGIIQIEFTPENAETLLDIKDVSKTLTEMPVLKNGHMAIIETEGYTYLSHTNYELTGTVVQFPSKKFKKESGWFSSDFEGQDVMVKYLKHDDKIIIGIVPYDEIYNRRNTIVKWLVFIIPIVIVIITLTIRNKVLQLEKGK